MISTAQTSSLPHAGPLKQICKSMAVLDAILSPEWQYRYHSYNSAWAEGEEFFEMRNGEGDQLLILFLQDSAVINGISLEEEPADLEELSGLLPEKFHEFIYAEPVLSAGTNFCLWHSLEQKEWQTPQPPLALKTSAELLSPLAGDPLAYKKWADAYFENEGRNEGIPLDLVKQVFEQKELSKSMVLALAPAFTDWDQLREDLEEISYQYHF